MTKGKKGEAQAQPEDDAPVVRVSLTVAGKHIEAIRMEQARRMLERARGKRGRPRDTDMTAIVRDALDAFFKTPPKQPPTKHGGRPRSP